MTIASMEDVGIPENVRVPINYSRLSTDLKCLSQSDEVRSTEFQSIACTMSILAVASLMSRRYRLYFVTQWTLGSIGNVRVSLSLFLASRCGRSFSWKKLLSEDSRPMLHRRDYYL